MSPLANERINAMSDTSIGLDQIEEEIFTYEVSDEALETAAGSVKEKAGALTLPFCSGLDTCPATHGIVTRSDERRLAQTCRTTNANCLAPFHYLVIQQRNVSSRTFRVLPSNAMNSAETR